MHSRPCDRVRVSPQLIPLCDPSSILPRLLRVMVLSSEEGVDSHLRQEAAADRWGETIAEVCV